MAVGKPQLAEDGPIFEPLVELPKPVPAMPVPKVKVRDLGLQPSPVPGVVLQAFTDENDRPKYFVTEKEIFFMKPDGKVMKKMARKSDPRKNREAASVGFSDDGRWVWQVYVPAEHAGDRLYYEAAATEVYDDKGKPWWTVAGNMESISPSGKRAVIALPESAGLVLHEKDSKTEKMVEDKGTAMSWACAFDDGYLYVSSGDRGSEISVYDARLEKKVMSRFKAHCVLDGCLPSVDRAIVNCSGSRVGILLLLDSYGREIARTWFPSAGNRHLDFDRKHGRVLVGVSSGEALYFDVSDGHPIHLARRLVGLPEITPRSKFVGTNDEYKQYEFDYYKQKRSMFLVVSVKVMEGAISRVLSRWYHRDEDPRRVFEVVDFSGAVLFAREFKLEDSDPRYRFDLGHGLWTDGNVARVPSSGKVQMVEVTREVRP
jgi:hypothetical protein